MTSNQVPGSPFDNYVLSWRFFRCMSNENMVFSEAVSNSNLFKNSRFENVVDVGTGDGDVINRIIKTKPEISITLIEPSDTYLSIAKLLVEHESEKLDFLQVSWKNYINDKPALYLALHMIYLLDEDEINKLFKLADDGSDVIFIVDDDSSIFSQLWKICAPTYKKKCEFFYKNLKDYKCTTKKIESQVISPYADGIEEKTKNSLLSTMCYTDYSKANVETTDKVKDLIQKHSNNDVVNCISNLIEVSGR